MRRKVFWTVLLFVAVVGTHGIGRAGAQQLLDPSPVDEAPEPASDLPLPEQSLVVEQPLRDYSRAYFGVTFDPAVRNAAVARSVIAGSPADEAGVLAGDTIVSLNGTKTATYDAVLDTIGRLKPGDVLDVEVTRRVSVRTRAVLEGTPVVVEHTTGYGAEPESLPQPAGSESETPVLRAPANRAPARQVPPTVNTPRSRQGASTPQNRNPNVNPDGDSNRGNDDRERDNRGFRERLRRR